MLKTWHFVHKVYLYSLYDSYNKQGLVFLHSIHQLAFLMEANCVPSDTWTESLSTSSNFSLLGSNLSSSVRIKYEDIHTYIVVVYPFVPLQTQGNCEVSLSALLPANLLISCYVSPHFSPSSKMVLIQVCFDLPLHLVHCKFQPNSCFSIDSAPFLSE
jgi:hypothetical protein